MQLQGVKNLPKLNQYNQQALQSLAKKQEQSQKYTRGTYERLEEILKNIQACCLLFDKSIAKPDKDFEQNQTFYSEFASTFQKVFSSQKQFGEKLLDVLKGVDEQYVGGYKQQSDLISQFQAKVKLYRSKQVSLSQSHKRFGKLYKSMIGNIERYKQSFTDVRLIYNRQQRLKRYNNGQANYIQIMREKTSICEMTEEMSNLKKEMEQLFQKVTNICRKNMMTVGYKIRAIETNFVQKYCEMQNQILKMVNSSFQKVFHLSLQFRLQSSSITEEQKKYIEESNEIVPHSFIPSVILNFTHIKETHYPHMGIFLMHIQKELQELTKRRKALSKFMLEMLTNFQKAYDRYASTCKQLSGRYEKRKKKTQEFYGPHPIFIKSFTKTIEIIIEHSQKMSKQISVKAKNIEQLLSEQSKIIDWLFKDFKAVSDKFFAKKDGSKRSSFDKYGAESNRQQIQRVQINNIKTESIEKLQTLKNIFQQTYEKIKKNCVQIKCQYDSILQVMEKIIIEKYTDLKEIIELGQQFAVNHLKDNAAEVEKHIAAKTKYFQESVFGSLSQDENYRITFEPDLFKVEEFKKLKKPTETLSENKEEKEGTDQLKRKSTVKEEIKLEEIQHQGSPQPVAQHQQGSQMSPQKGENASKNEAFLLTKTSFLPEEKYFKSYICGLADKIILSGRLYITNQRLFFFSKFNPKNLFFGDTFIEVPKRDIKKIEKRSNAVIFHNSISITTVHGQLFFTSFFSRNQAFDMICSALELTFDDILYVEQKNEEVLEQQMITEEQDDIKQSTLTERQIKINQLISKYDHPYKEVLETQFTFQGLNALKLFKLFQLNNEIKYHRSKYRGFNHFFKLLIGHTELQLDDWNPNTADYFNSGNLKQSIPLSFTKKFTSLVPVVNSGIPFMPKTSKVSENMELFFYSKDKYVVCTTTHSFGVPYCDHFVIYYKKEVETIDIDKCSYKVFFHIHFHTPTMVKNLIQSKAYEESKVGLKKLEEEMKKYMKYLQKMKAKSSVLNEQGTEEKIANAQQEFNEQIQQFKKENEQLNSNLKVEKEKNKKIKLYLWGSLLLNVFFLFYFLSFSQNNPSNVK